MKSTINESVIKDNFIKKSLKDKMYHLHSDIDLWINIAIKEILNYNKLLGKKKLSSIKSNKKYSYLDIEKNVNMEKLECLKKINEGKNSENQNSNKKNSILGYEIPNCEIYFIVKLYVDEIEKKPSYQTKIVFNQKNINQTISFKYKYKDLNEESYIIIEIYSVELVQENSFLGKSKIYLFDKNLNLFQGRHSIKINPNLENEKKEYYSEQEKEIDILINSFYGKEYENSENYYGEGDNKEGIKIENLNIDEIKDNYFYNLETKEPQIKTELIRNFEFKLKELLEITDNSFIVVQFPSFKYQVIYEEQISENYKENYKIQIKEWIKDASIFNGKNFFVLDNPVTKKFDLLFEYQSDDLSKEVRLNPDDEKKINKLLNTPDFIDLGDDKEIFWKYRYELQRNNTHDALTKILNSVNWNKKEIYEVFFRNILHHWKNIEMCDILYILSRKFSVNKLFMDNIGIKDLEGLKTLRKFAVNRLNKFSTTELNFILLQLVQAIKYEDISRENFYTPLVKLLVEKSKLDLNFASSFYWLIECESNKSNEKILSPIFNKIKEYFLENIKKNKIYSDVIKSEIEFKIELAEIAINVNQSQNKTEKLKEIVDKVKKNIMHNEEHYLPIEPKIKIKGIVSDKCQIFTSAKQPIKYTFKMTKETKKYNPFGDANYYETIFKLGDDLRQDQLILQMINFMDSILKKRYIDCEFTIYRVLATSQDDGFVEFVPNSKTYSNILKSSGKLKSYFINKIDNQEEFKKKLDKFINSLAGYCAVNYILGIGDRHNDNIMIRNNGCLFHIDFGYIFGNEPKFKTFFPFKITADMVDFMGGKDSENYKKFTNKSVNAYLILRENARTIVNMFYLMIDSQIPQIKDIESLKKLHEKFALDLSKDQAKNKFLTELENSLESYIPGIQDELHEIGQKFAKK